MKKSEILKLVAFIVLPAGFIAGSIYYGPRIKGWIQNKIRGKQEGADKETKKE